MCFYKMTQKHILKIYYVNNKLNIFLNAQDLWSFISRVTNNFHEFIIKIGIKITSFYEVVLNEWRKGL